MKIEKYCCMEIEKYLKSISDIPEKKPFFRLSGWVWLVISSVKKYCKYVYMNNFGDSWLFFISKF
jgi:hypothetical protein